MKRELHVRIDEDLYLFIREYAKQYIELGYKNWMGKAVEDAINALRERIHTQHTSGVNGYLVNKVTVRETWLKQVNERVKNRVLRIYDQIRDKKQLTFSELITVIVSNSGSDYRTIAKYINILQGVFGLRFHARNPCIVLVENDPDIDTIRIDMISNPVKRLQELMQRCMK